MLQPCRQPGRRRARANACRPHRLLAIVSVLAGLASVLPLAAREMQAPNSRVVLDLPDGFVPATQFAGFVQEATGASMIVLEVPGRAYDDMKSGFTPAQLASRGIRDARPGTLSRPGEHIYMTGEQASPAGTYAKHFMLFREGDVTALVSVNIPKASIEKGEIRPADIEKALASARLAPAGGEKALFRLSYLGPFQEAAAFLGTAKIYTLDGKLGSTPGAAPAAMLIVAPSLDIRPIPDLAPYARRLAGTVEGLKAITVAEERTTTVAGLEAAELIGHAQNIDNDEPQLVYQLVVRGRTGGHFRVLGLARRAQEATYLPEFRRIAASFEPAP